MEDMEGRSEKLCGSECPAPRQVLQQLLQRVVREATAACETQLDHLPRDVRRQGSQKVRGIIPLCNEAKPRSQGKMRCQRLVPQLETISDRT